MPQPNPYELIGYLEEALPIAEMTRIEEQLRNDPVWRDALHKLLDGVDLKDHSVATIWRRHRLTCPGREKLGLFVLGGLVPDEEDYIRFHLDVIGCRHCSANLDDLKESLLKETPDAAESARRRRRIFESSVGSLAKRQRD